MKKKSKENDVEFDFRSGTVLVIFSFLLMDNDILSPERRKYIGNKFTIF